MLAESFNRTRWLDGASQKAEGPEGPMAPIVTTDVPPCKKKKPFSHVIFVLGDRSTDPRIVRVILAPKPCNFHRSEKRSHANLLADKWEERQEPVWKTVLEVCKVLPVGTTVTQAEFTAAVEASASDTVYCAKR